MKLIRLLLVALLLFNTTIGVVSAAEPTIEYFVDANAELSGDGSIDAPFATVQEAQEQVRSLKRSGQYPSGGVIVTLRGGDYRMNETLTFTAEDSGKEGAPVVYRAYPMEEVNFSGSASLKLGDFVVSTDERIPASAQGKVYQYSLTANNVEPYKELQITGHASYYIYLWGLTPYNGGDAVPTVYINDEPGTLARYPNGNEFMTIESVQEAGSNIRDLCRVIEEGIESRKERSMDEVESPVFTPAGIDLARAERWSNAKNAWMNGYWFYDWSDQTIPVASVDGATKQITCAAPSTYQVRNGQRFFIYNLIEELDDPGEWFYDKDNGTLYIYPKQAKADAIVDIAFNTNPIVVFNGAEWIDFRNINVAATRSDAIKVHNSKDINIFGCTARNAANCGITVDSNCRRVVVDSCHVYNLGYRGIEIGGGDLITLERGDNVATNNWVHDFGQTTKTYAPGIGIGGVGTIVRNNLIHDGPSSGITFSGNDTLIERNEIHSVMKEGADMGVMYFGRSTLDRGQVIRENIIHDMASDSAHGGQNGIYLDDMGAQVDIVDNLFYNLDGCAVFVNGGRDNHVENNLFINCTTAMDLTDIGMASGWDYNLDFFKQFLLKDTDRHLSEPYAKYEHLANILEDDPLMPKYNTFKNNVAYKVDTLEKISNFVSGGSTLTPADVRKVNTWESNVMVNSLDGFVDPANSNYNVKPNGLIQEKAPNYKPVDFTKASLITSRLKVNLSDDAIVLSVGKPLSYVNWKQALVDPKNLSVVPFIENDYTMVPVRFLIESLGGKADFVDGKVILNYEGRELVMTSGSAEATIDGETVMLDNAAKIVDGRTFIPLRNCSELFGKEVFWDNGGLIVVSGKNMTDILDVDMIDNLLERLAY
ncbi:MAG: right-handed parallel beta-helix repeat-containing protein [Clostridia bacterium]|nr:right-handed parallel beta-helix repeat-containing protein [Clostridia bacterium]